MPSGRNTRQTSTTNLEKHHEESDTATAGPSTINRKAKNTKSTKPLNPEAVEAYEDAHGPIMPSPSCDSLPHNNSMPSKHKDIEFLNTINSMINKSTEIMTANFDRRFDDNEERMMLKIQNLEETQSQEIWEMGKEIKN